MAGFSLGEYAAFTAAGVIPDIGSGVELIKKRGAFMAEAGRHADGSARGAMAAVLGAREDILALVEVSRGEGGEYVLEAVNYNAPTQTVIAGDAEAIEIFAAKAKESEKKLRVMPLPVSTAFHSPIMESASERIREAASFMDFYLPRHMLYLNMTGERFSDFIAGEDAKGITLKGSLTGADMSLLIPDIMARQVKSPVLWQQIMENIAASGAELIIEFGPGKTLTGLAKKSAPGVTALNVQDAESLETAVRALREI
jgi:[acyl-carrier-protein] S-malonyltransferase